MLFFYTHRSVHSSVIISDFLLYQVGINPENFSQTIFRDWDIITPNHKWDVCAKSLPTGLIKICKIWKENKSQRLWKTTMKQVPQNQQGRCTYEITVTEAAQIVSTGWHQISPYKWKEKLTHLFNSSPECIQNW